MVRPLRFGFNEYTAASNAFQQRSSLPDGQVQENAIMEFDRLVDVLRSKEINVIVVDDLKDPVTPDAVFPNNWIAFMPGGHTYTFPMEAPVRRLERREDVIDRVGQEHTLQPTIDLSFFELERKYLEGTGSVVLDHIHQVAYACRSSRTDESVFTYFINQIDYRPVLFNARDQDGQPIYHTNVLMAVGERFAVLCGESVDLKDRSRVYESLETTDHTVVDISFEQLRNFAGNMIELTNAKGHRILLMSTSAHRSLRQEQLEVLEQFAEIVHSDIPTIEQLGGGSVRCMVAGIHSESRK